ncbi:hypothetical protein WUBG_00523 [Wuchereria bancrofti]|uniref:Uncharacterized protein n=1 Tax=Wuchereria bancrofti TaxID=6293 RepID=J9F261_WUCBA|nr:hypothetical protein WUBG_00523 [Wuchereria bancrofti]
MESLVLLFLNSWRAVGAGGVMYGGVRGRGSEESSRGFHYDNGKKNEEEVVVAIAVVQTSDVAG